MKIYGFEKSMARIHPHDMCGICCGNVRSKSGTRQKGKKKIIKQLRDIE